MMELSKLLESIQNTDPAQYLELIFKLGSLLDAESQACYPEFSSRGGLVSLTNSGKALVIGDLHGDLQSLILILEPWLKLIQTSDLKLVFLGDYIDRGSHSIQLLQLIFMLKLRYPSKLILLKGNHEGTYFIPVHPHDLPHQLELRFAGDSQLIYRELLWIFSKLPHAALAPERYLMVHGGIPQLDSAQQLIDPEPQILEQILWNDPDEFIQGFRESPRGAGKLFGSDISSRTLDRLGVKLLIRSHQPCNGIMHSHGGRVITVFSRKGAPYFNTRAAYLELSLDSGSQLEPIPRWF